MPLAETLTKIRNSIEKERKNSPIGAPAVTLLGASKGQSAPIIREAISYGVTDFGENRVQEAEEKWEAIRKDHPGTRLHLIGPLQTNKVKQAVALFDVIQTVDREKLADALAGEMEKANKKLACYIQVNTGSEPQKAGVTPDEAAKLIDYCQNQLKLNIAGLMCIPPAEQVAAPHFALLYEIARTHKIAGLSMGMSNDYETAVRMGSSCVRLGRILFGERA